MGLRSIIFDAIEVRNAIQFILNSIWSLSDVLLFTSAFPAAPPMSTSLYTISELLALLKSILTNLDGFYVLLPLSISWQLSATQISEGLLGSHTERQSLVDCSGICKKGSNIAATDEERRAWQGLMDLHKLSLHSGKLCYQEVFCSLQVFRDVWEDFNGPCCYLHIC